MRAKWRKKRVRRLKRKRRKTRARRWVHFAITQTSAFLLTHDALGTRSYFILVASECLASFRSPLRLPSYIPTTTPEINRLYHHQLHSRVQSNVKHRPLWIRTEEGARKEGLGGSIYCRMLFESSCIQNRRFESLTTAGWYNIFGLETLLRININQESSASHHDLVTKVETT